MENQQVTLTENNISYLLAAQVLHFFREKNRTIGIAQDTQFARGLAVCAFWLYRKQVESKLQQAAVLKEIITQCKVEIRRITNNVNEGDITIDEQRQGLVKARLLNEQAERITIRLEKLNNHVY